MPEQVSEPNQSEHATPIRFRGAGGVDLAGDSWGPEDGPLAVFLHGGGQTRHSWKKAGARLAKNGIRSVLLDARGHGDSAWADDYGRDVMAEDLIRVLEQLGKPACVIGASMGGLTALLASARPGSERIEKLVLVDIVPRTEELGVSRVVNFLTSHHDGFATLDEAADAVAEYLPHRPRPDSNAGLLRNLRKRDDGRWYWHWDPAMLSGRPEDGNVHTEVLEEAASKLRIPVLVIKGRLSDVVSDEGVEAFRALVPHLQYVEIGDAAHTAAGDDNDAFSDAVAAFVLKN